MKRASWPLIALTGLFSLSLAGCGATAPPLPAPPVILNLPDCPSPARPRLAPVDGDLPFDAPANVAAFMERDDALRLHVRALDDTIACFRRQSPGKEE